jgi:hypothetical protein
MAKKPFENLSKILSTILKELDVVIICTKKDLSVPVIVEEREKLKINTLNHCRAPSFN